MEKIVVFDFDKTLTNYDTTLSFFLYSCKYKPFRYVFIPIYLIVMVSSKFKLITVKRGKEIGLILFCPKEISEFLTLCKNFASTIKLNRIYAEEFKNFENKNFKLIIASASFQYYLEEIFPNTVIFGTTIELDIHKKNILGIENHPFKEQKLKSLIQNGYTKIDKFYTDSINDKSTAKISKEVIWIKKGEIINIDYNQI